MTSELSLRLLERTEAPVTAHKGYVCLDFDTRTMDNRGTKKEAVSRTYRGFDGYTPIAAYLGNEGWNIGLELRPGKQHSALETETFLERIFPRVERLAAAGVKVPRAATVDLTVFACGSPTAMSGIAWPRWVAVSTTSSKGTRADRINRAGSLAPLLQRLPGNASGQAGSIALSGRWTCLAERAQNLPPDRPGNREDHRQEGATPAGA